MHNPKAGGKHDLVHGRLSSDASPNPLNRKHRTQSLVEKAWTEGTGIQELLAAEDGYIVGRLDDHLLRLRTDAHLLTIAPTGAGKGVGAIIPNLLDHPGSAFVVDIRGETVAKTATARRLLGQTVVVLDPFDVTGGRWGADCYNPLDILDADGRTFEADVGRITGALMHDPEGRKSKEPIWDNITRDLINGALTYIKFYQPFNRQNLCTVCDFFTSSQSEQDEMVRNLRSICEREGDETLIAIRQLLTSYTSARTTTKYTDNGITQAYTLLSWAGQKNFKKILKRSTFSFKDMQRRPTTVYLVVPEEHMSQCTTWIRVMFEAALFSLDDVYMTRGIATADLPQQDRVLFLLDEFPAFGKLEPVQKGMATVRGRGVNFWIFLQNIAQLDSIYGEHDAKVIIGNMAMTQIFGSSEINELEYFSRVVGDEMFDVESVTIGATKSSGDSVTQGQTITVSNSESIARSDSSSIAIGQTYGRGSGISEAEGVSETDSIATTEGQMIGETETIAENAGLSTSTSMTLTGPIRGIFDTLFAPHWKTRSTTDTMGWSWSRNHSRAYSSSLNQARTRGKSFASTKTITSSQNISDTFSHNLNKGHSETRTGGSGISDAKQQSATESRSTAETMSVTIKPEQRRVKTPRALRQIINEGNQLLTVRGYFPFFSPRMRYNYKSSENNWYLFPAMAALVTDEIGSANKIINNILRSLPAVPDFQIGTTVHELLSVDNDHQAIERLESCIYDVTSSLAIANNLRKRFNAYFIELDNFSFFIRIVEEIWLEQSRLIQDDRASDAEPESIIDSQKFRNLISLPLFTDACPISALEDKRLSKGTFVWLAKQYHGVINEVLGLLDREMIDLRRCRDKIVRQSHSLITKLALIEKSIDTFSADSITKEIERKYKEY